MRKLTTILGAASAGVTCLAFCPAPQAHASITSYLYEVEVVDDISSPGGDAVILDWGYRVCNDQRAGAAPAYSAANIDMQTALNYAGAMQVVRAALVHLC